MHEPLGPGLLESVYRTCLVIELREAGLHVEETSRIPLTYRGHELDIFFYPDLIIGHRVLVELKSVSVLAAVHTAQVLTYLKLTGLPVGLLINFNVPYLKQGTRRVVRPASPFSFSLHTPGADAEGTLAPSAMGRRTVTIVPAPLALVTSIMPPLSSMLRRAMGRPRPVPVVFVEK